MEDPRRRMHKEGAPPVQGLNFKEDLTRAIMVQRKKRSS